MTLDILDHGPIVGAEYIVSPGVTRYQFQERCFDSRTHLGWERNVLRRGKTLVLLEKVPVIHPDVEHCSLDRGMAHQPAEPRTGSPPFLT